MCLETFLVSPRDGLLQCNLGITEWPFDRKAMRLFQWLGECVFVLSVLIFLHLAIHPTAAAATTPLVSTQQPSAVVLLENVLYCVAVSSEEYAKKSLAGSLSLITNVSTFVPHAKCFN